jgi:hypothetical protein
MDGSNFSVAAEQFLKRRLTQLNVQTLADLPSAMRKDLLKQARQIVLNDVFGVGHKLDKAGRPQEQGLGSAAQPTKQSVEAYKKYGVSEPEYAATLARMERDLAAFEARRAAEAKHEEDVL